MSNHFMKLDPTTNTCIWAMPIRNGSVHALARRGNEILMVGSFLDNPVQLPGAPKPDNQASFIASFDPASQTFTNVKYLVTLGVGGVGINALTTDALGNVYVVGDFSGQLEFHGQTLSSVVGNGGYDGFAAAYDANLSMQWIHVYGGGGLEIPRAIVAFDDTLYVSGTTNGGHPSTPIALQPWNCGSIDDDCMFLLKLRASDGATQWGRYFGVGNRPNFAHARVAAGGASDLWLSAGWAAEVNFGDKPLVPIGTWNQDIVIAKFSPLP